MSNVIEFLAIVIGAPALVLGIAARLVDGHW